MLPLLIRGGAAVAGPLARALGTAASPSAIMNFAKRNPGTFLLASKEVYDQGTSLYDLIKTEYPEELAALQNKAGISDDSRSAVANIDSVARASLDSLDDLADEMDTIDAAIRAVGSFDNLQALRRALMMDDNHYAMYLRLRRLSKRLG